MEFKNGYNFMYQKLKAIYASKTGKPEATDKPVDLGLTEEDIKNIKLVYENKDGFVANFTGLPTAEDKSFELTVNGELVVGPSGSEPGPEPTPLTPFTADGYLQAGDKLQINLNADATDIIAYLDTLDYDPQSGSTFLLAALTDGDEHNQQLNISAVKMNNMYMLTIVTAQMGYPGAIWMSQDGVTGQFITDQLDPDTDYYSLVDEHTYGPIQLNDSASGWNGKLFGVIKGE